MSTDKYILDHRTKEPVPEPNLFKWGKWFETANRRVAGHKIRGAWISTVFLGLDHKFYGGGPPIVFETMIFRGKRDGWMDRYCTWEAAKRGHRAAVILANGGRVPKSWRRKNQNRSRN